MDIAIINICFVAVTAILTVVIAILVVALYRTQETHSKTILLMERDFLTMMKTRPVVRVKVQNDKDVIFQPTERAATVNTAEQDLRAANYRLAREQDAYSGVPS